MLFLDAIFLPTRPTGGKKGALVACSRRSPPLGDWSHHGRPWRSIDDLQAALYGTYNRLYYEMVGDRHADGRERQVPRTQSDPATPFRAAGGAVERSSQIVALDTPNGDELYRLLKALEGQIPIPEPTAHSLVGTFDATTGRFTWGSGVKHVSQRETVPGKGSVTTIEHHLRVQAVHVQLVFRVQNRQTDFQLSVNGSVLSAPPGQLQLEVPVPGTTVEIDFTVSSGTRSFGDHLFIDRFAAGAGAITIDALPIALIYPPVQGKLKSNFVTYTALQFIGMKAGFSRMDATTQVKIDTNTISDLAEGARALGDAVADFNNVTGGVIKAVGLLLSGFGSQVQREEIGLQATIDHDVENTAIRGALLNTFPGLGPGEGGEVFVILQGVRAAWIADNGKLSIAIISTPSWGAHSTAALQADLTELQAAGAPKDARGLRTQLLPASISALLRLNPFFTPPNVPIGPVSLPEGRYRLPDPPYQYSITAAAVGDQLLFKTRIEQTDTEATTDTTATVTDLRAGWLSFLGVGPADDRTVTIRSSLTNLTRRTSGVEVATTLTANIGTDDPLRVTAHYDQVFGTFAFVTTGQQPPSRQ